MLDTVLSRKKFAVRMTVKGTVALLLAVMAVALPQIAHAAGGAQAGTVYMPMYLPVLLAGLLLGWQFGLAVGIISPVVSFLFTSLVFESAMPAAARLPYMIAELAVYGLITGLFAKKAQKSPLIAFPATLAAQACGRTVYVVYNLIAGRTFAELMSSVASGMTGLWLQAVIAPLIAILIFTVIKHEQKSDEG